MIGEDEIECQYPAWIERGMEAHKEWQERELQKLVNLLEAYATKRKRTRLGRSAG